MLSETMKVRLWAMAKVPLIAWLRPRVLELTDERAVVRIPLSRRAKNHWGSMYFGALCTGADVAGGIMAMRAIERSGSRVSLIFKDFRAEFLRRAEGDVNFVCEDGVATADLVARAAASGERENMPVTIRAYTEASPDPLAEFVLTLSLKRK